MNNKIKEHVDDLKSSLLEDELVKEYLSLKKEVYENEYLESLREKIKTAQKNMAKSLLDDGDYEAYKKEYESLMEEYKSHPIVHNYENISEQIKDLLLEIKDILE